MANQNQIPSRFTGPTPQSISDIYDKLNNLESIIRTLSSPAPPPVTPPVTPPPGIPPGGSGGGGGGGGGGSTGTQFNQIPILPTVPSNNPVAGAPYAQNQLMIDVNNQFWIYVGAPTYQWQQVGTATILLTDTAANLVNYPAANYPGALFFESTAPLLLRSDGVNWIAVVGEATIQKAEWLVVSGTGTDVAIIANTATRYTSLQPGFKVILMPLVTNSGGPVTLNVNGIGPQPVTKNGNTPLAGGELIAGIPYILIWDGTEFQINGNPNLGSLPDGQIWIGDPTNSPAPQTMKVGATLADDGTITLLKATGDFTVLGESITHQNLTGNTITTLDYQLGGSGGFNFYEAGTIVGQFANIDQSMYFSYPGTLHVQAGYGGPAALQVDFDGNFTMFQGVTQQNLTGDTIYKFEYQSGNSGGLDFYSGGTIQGQLVMNEGGAYFSYPGTFHVQAGYGGPAAVQIDNVGNFTMFAGVTQQNLTGNTIYKFEYAAGSGGGGGLDFFAGGTIEAQFATAAGNMYFAYPGTLHIQAGYSGPAVMQMTSDQLVTFFSPTVRTQNSGGNSYYIADAATGFQAGISMFEAGAERAQFVISGSNTYLDYYTSLNIRSNSAGGATAAVFDASGNVTFNGNVIGLPPRHQTDYASTRAIGTVYQNTSGSPIFVNISVANAAATASVLSSRAATVNPPNVQVGAISFSAALVETNYGSMSFWVPPGYFYQVFQNSGASTLITWIEWT